MRYELLPEFESLLTETTQEVLLEIAPVPKGLPRMEHYAVLKTPDAGSGRWVAASMPSPMNPANMNPGFLSADNKSLVIASALQQSLASLIQSKYKKYIRGQRPSAADDISVAVADLSGKKIIRPDYAGWGSTVPRYAASTAKIAPLYAVHQLRADLEQLLQTALVRSLNDAVKVIGQYQRRHGLDATRLQWSKIFTYDFSPPKVAVSFSPEVQQTIDNTFRKNNNYEASKLIHHVSYPYLGSVLWQSGLRNPTLGGLWQVSDYGNAPSGINRRWPNAPALSMQSGSHTITALSGVTYFTLLAQGRLVNDSTSQQIKETLRTACSFFWSGKMAALTGITRRPPAKCGIWSQHYNDVILVEYEDSRYRYAACVLTTLARDNNFLMDDILADLDGLIRSNNP